VDWSSVLRSGSATGQSGTSVTSGLFTGRTNNPNVQAADGLFRLVVQNARITAALTALAREGRLQVLSSPRISTMNNQKAILRVVREEAYFLQSSEATPTGGNSGVLVTSTITPIIVPVGIVLDIQPQVAEDGTITLAVNPSVSEVVTTRSFSASGQGGEASATLPVVDRRDLDTVVRMRNGETLVMAGIIQTKEGFDDRGVPWFRRIPIFGNLFSKREKTKSHTELAIFITPTLVEDPTQVHAQTENAEQRLEKSGADLNPQPIKDLPAKTP
jgi:type II secretory pathway component GspD/PulD (secretin)